MSLLDTASLIVTPNGYKASKLYSVKPTDASGDMVVSRATTATRVNSSNLIESVAINVPRLDYTLGGCPSILVEPARTNLLLRSEEFDNASWAKTNATVTANVTTAPDNTMTADKLVDDATLTQHRINQTPTAAIGTYTFSVFLKKAEIDTRWIRIGNSGADFNLTNGTTYGEQSGVTSSIENYGNGWYRCSITRTTTGANEICRINLKDSSNATYTGNGVDGFYLWGAQLEAGSYDTSYIPTTTATVTRNADVISKTGISSLIGQTEGTIYAEINNTLMTSYSTGYVMRIFADANNEVWIRKESGTNTYTARWRANSVDVYTQSTISVLNGNNKIAIAYKTGDSAVYLNGTQIGTSASTGAFAVAPSQIGIGSSSTADFFNDRIELATLFQTRLTNAQLATLTTL